MHGNITGKRTGQRATKAAPPDASKKTDSSALPHTTRDYALRPGMSTRTCVTNYAGSYPFYAILGDVGINHVKTGCCMPRA